MSNLSEDVLQLLTDLNIPDGGVKENKIKEVTLKLVFEIKLPEYDSPEDMPYNEDFYQDLPDKAERNLNFLSRLLEEIINAKQKGYISTDDLIKSTTVEIFFNITQYSSTDFEWSNQNIVDLVIKIQGNLSFLCGFDTVEQLLLGEDDFSLENLKNISFDDKDQNDKINNHRFYANGILKLLLQLFAENFNKNNWKRHPGLKCLYYWILKMLKVK